MLSAVLLWIHTIRQTFLILRIYTRIYIKHKKEFKINVINWTVQWRFFANEYRQFIGWYSKEKAKQRKLVRRKKVSQKRKAEGSPGKRSPLPSHQKLNLYHKANTGNTHAMWNATGLRLWHIISQVFIRIILIFLNLIKKVSYFYLKVLLSNKITIHV